MPAPAPLPDLPLFRRLAPEAARVLAAAPRRRFRRGQVLWPAGAEAGALAVVLSGRVRVVRAVPAGRSAGRQYGVHAEGPGGTLGEVPFFAGGRYPATAVAAEPTTCLVLDRATLARAVAADPELALRWLARLAGRVRRLVERLDDQTGRTVEQRLATLLLERHAAAGGAAFALAATQAEAAEELGTVREVLVRALRGLRAGGLVASPVRGRYVVRDRTGLARIAASDADWREPAGAASRAAAAVLAAVGVRPHPSDARHPRSARLSAPDRAAGGAPVSRRGG